MNKRFGELKTDSAEVQVLGEQAWRLSIPAGDARAYRVAQIDDYSRRTRKNFPWQPPVRLDLQARASAADIPGTRGFGLWNDPFSMGTIAGGGLRLPALPNTAWFFFASPPNYLSLRDDRPAQGPLAATFRSPPLPTAWVFLAAPALPWMAWRPGFQLLRRVGRKILRQDAASLPIDPTGWHNYRLEWREASVVFWVDGEIVLETTIVPRGPLGAVIWVDNQFMALPQDNRPKYGWLEGDDAWIEVQNFSIENIA